MTYKVIDIEGVGESYAVKLNEAGIKTTDDYLAACKTPAQRKALAQKTAISDKLILKWANHCDLIRIHGVGPQFAELLERAGVDTVKELSKRVPENLHPKIEETNAKFNLVNRVPALKEVVKFVNEAKALPVVLEY